jgi:hypothetical protein
MLYSPSTYTAPTVDLTPEAFRLAYSVLYPDPIPLSDETGALPALDMEAIAADTNRVDRSASGSSTSQFIRFETIREMGLAGGIARALGYAGLAVALQYKLFEFKTARGARDDQAVNQARMVDGECARLVLEAAVKFPGTIIPTHVDSGQRPKILIPVREVQAAITHKLDVPRSDCGLGDLPVATPMDIIFARRTVPRRTLSGLARSASSLLRTG